MNNVETKKNFDLRSESGFTLMELIVVIGVLAILMTILIPQFNGYTDKAKATAARAQGRTALTAVSGYAISSDTAGRGFVVGDATTVIQDSLGMNAANPTPGLTVTVTDKTNITVVKDDGDLQFTTTINSDEGTMTFECQTNDRCDALVAAGSVDGAY